MHRPLAWTKVAGNSDRQERCGQQKCGLLWESGGENAREGRVCSLDAQGRRSAQLEDGQLDEPTWAAFWSGRRASAHEQLRPCLLGDLYVGEQCSVNTICACQRR